MDNAIEKIEILSKNICTNIERSNATERGFLSQNILSQLRNLVEAALVALSTKNTEVKYDYNTITNVIQLAKGKSSLNILSRFHKLLQMTTSHYIMNEENSERLMLKYYEYMIKLKNLVKDELEIDILYNIHKFPLNVDKEIQEYGDKVVEVIENTEKFSINQKFNDRYYIQKITPFIRNGEIYYEVTLTEAREKVSKFDRIIAYTKCDILYNYAVKLRVKNGEIEVLGKKIPINIIDEWEVSIRPCELKNFSAIFGDSYAFNAKEKEYNNLMNLLTNSNMDLVQLVLLKEKEYNMYKNIVLAGTTKAKFFNTLDKSRRIINNCKDGANVLRYLLYRLNNKIIKLQYFNQPRYIFSNLYIDTKNKAFDIMPLATSLKNHNPKIGELIYCIDLQDREHEFLARKIKYNTENNGQLFTPVTELGEEIEINNLIKAFNCKVHAKHANRCIHTWKKYVYNYGDVLNVYNILSKLKTYSNINISNYKASFNEWISENTYRIDCDEKVAILSEMFENSRVSLIYGAAGTGKSTLINHISNYFNDKDKLYLAVTNTAVDNLKRKVHASKTRFMTVKKGIKGSGATTDILIIDECSMVSNQDMMSVLEEINFEILILVGDIYQIEAIQFGSWFENAKYILPKASYHELSNQYRSTNRELQKFWNSVRSIGDSILENSVIGKYSERLNESIFNSYSDDEIILCLNYDGLYGINNINNYLQISNPNEAVTWGVLDYKVGDPIVFNETERFSPLLYNNLKGRIYKITKDEGNKFIEFDIEIYKVITNLDAQNYDFEIVGITENKSTFIRFRVLFSTNTDNDDIDNSENIVPFQVTYAISMHKAQGLEYDSVKIVISPEVEERITHNIFYTAITRAKNKLKIYWSPETERKVLSDLSHKKIDKDLNILKKIYPSL